MAVTICVFTAFFHACNVGWWPLTSHDWLNTILSCIFTPAILLGVEEIYYRSFTIGGRKVGGAFGYFHWWLRGVVLALWSVFGALWRCDNGVKDRGLGDDENENVRVESEGSIPGPEASGLPPYSELDMKQSPIRYHSKADWAV